MLRLIGTGHVLRIDVVSAADLDIHVSAAQLVQSSGAYAAGVMDNLNVTGTGETTLLSGHATNDVTLRLLTIHNIDTADTAAFRIEVTDGTHVAQLQPGPNGGLSLAPGEMLVINGDGTIFVFDTSGGVKIGASAASDTAAGLIEIATQAEQEAGTDTAKAVTSGRQHYHPSAAKFWFKAGVAANLLASYNMTSLTDVGAGVVTATIATDFSGADWCCLYGILNLDASIDATTDKQTAMGANASQAAGSVQLICGNETGTAAADPQNWFCAGFGDHA